MRLKETLRKLIAIFIIITITLLDFSVIAKNTVSYAIDMVATNSDNVNFSAYFKNEKDEEITETDFFINAENIKMYVEIYVKKEGYFNGIIELGNSSFDILNNTQNEYVQKIEENKVYLNKIAAGNTVKIELNIKYRYNEKTEINTLNQNNEIILNGTYISSEKQKEIKGNTSVKINWKSEEKVNAILDAQILTNEIQKINEENKRLLQILVNSKLTNNSYPINNTEFEVELPVVSEKVEVYAKSTDSTNNEMILSDKDYKYDENTRKVNINLKNEEVDGKVNWKKNAIDTIVISCIYNETEDIFNKNIEIKSKIRTYDEKELSAERTVVIDKEIKGLATVDTKNNENEIYKGKIYTREDRSFITTTNLNINYAQSIQSITLKESNTLFVGENENKGNVRYIQSKIYKYDFQKIFGEDGKLDILDQKNNIIATIDKNSETDDNGFINVIYSQDLTNIKINISKPIIEGILKIEHIKSIDKMDYTREQIRKFEYLKNSVSVSYIDSYEKEEINQMVNLINLKETESKADIKVSVDKLSTLSENNNIEIVATLQTNDETKDLYKNPIINIVFPNEIKNVQIKQAKALYRNGLKVVKTAQYRNDSGNIVISVKFEGEQKEYNGEVLNGLEVHFYGNISVNKNTPSKHATLKMDYTNENSINKEHEAITQIQLESQYGLMLYNKLEKFNSKNEIIETTDENKAEAKIDVNKNHVASEVTTEVINNYNEVLKNIELIGKIPSKNLNSNFDSKIEGLKVNNKNAKIKYDSNLGNYRVIIPELKAGETAKISYILNLEDKLKYNLEGQFVTKVSTNYNGKDISTSSNIVFATEKIKLNTLSEGQTLNITEGVQANIVAVSGNKELNNGEEIFDGSTIKYIIKLKNNTDKDYESINIKAVQNNGKILGLKEREVFNVRYGIDGKGIEHYFEVLDTNEYEISNIKLQKNSEVKLEYQTVVQKLNNIETYGTITIKSTDGSLDKNIDTIKNTIKDSELSLVLRPKESEECIWTSNTMVETILSIKNNTSSELKNVKVYVTTSKELSVEKLKNCLEYDSEKAKITVDKIEKNINGDTVSTLNVDFILSSETINIIIPPEILKFDGENKNIEMYASAMTESNNVYNSNNMTRKIYQGVEESQLNITKTINVNGQQMQKDTVLKNADKVEINLDIKNNNDKKTTLLISSYINTNLKNVNITLIKDNIETNVNKNIENSSLSLNHDLEAGSQIKIRILADFDNTLVTKDSMSNDITVTDMTYYQEYEQNTTFNVMMPDDGIPNIEVNQVGNYSDGTIIKDGDTVKYNINIKNTCNYERKVNIYDYINSAIKNVKILINGKDVTNNYLDGNDLKIEDYLIEGNTETSIVISGKFDLNGYQQTSISNVVNIKCNMVDLKSNSITYYVSQEDKNREESTDYIISGIAWIDSNKNGKRDSKEEVLENMVVRAINTNTNEVVTRMTETREDGTYNLSLPKGKYILIFMYDNDKFYITTYQAKDVSDKLNSDVVSKKVKIDNESIIVGATDVINLSEDKKNINIGLIEREKFDLKLEKSVDKIIVSNKQGTKTYNCNNSTLAKAEIASKYLRGSTVVVQYSIKVTNVGDIDGYAKNIVDYMPSGMSFSSDLNSDWYKSGKYLYNESLSNKKIKVGETKEVNLILTKTMTASNTGLVNNTAKINKAYNLNSVSDTNIDNNSSSADVIISIKTGLSPRIILLTLNLILIVCIGTYYILKRRKNTF